MRMFPSIRMIATFVCVGLLPTHGQSVRADPSHPSHPSDTEDGITLSISSPVEEGVCCCQEQDRVYLLSTRHLTYDACRAPLQHVPFRMWQVSCESSQCINPDDYQSSISIERPVVFYIHGNRMSSDEVVCRALTVRREIRSRCGTGAIDWVIFSWPSEREPGALRDFREKADRCDAQGLYLASFMRKHVEASIPIAMIGYSFGARVATGALHALAGGTLSGRRLPESPVTGANVRIGLVAPAIESNWLCGNGYHRRATKNMERLLLLYNRRDVVLKRYWLIEKVRRETALGFSGPSCFASRADGTRLPVRSRDCSPSVKLRHSELDYYQKGCNAGCDMSRLISGFGQTNL
jgi:hypothetical protein